MRLYCTGDFPEIVGNDFILEIKKIQWVNLRRTHRMYIFQKFSFTLQVSGIELKKLSLESITGSKYISVRLKQPFKYKSRSPPTTPTFVSSNLYLIKLKSHNCNFVLARHLDYHYDSIYTSVRCRLNLEFSLNMFCLTTINH